MHVYQSSYAYNVYSVYTMDRRESQSLPLVMIDCSSFHPVRIHLVVALQSSFIRVIPYTTRLDTQSVYSREVIIVSP